jgi:hypothetical protein
VATIDANKLVRNFQARAGNPQEILLNWDLPVDFTEGEEIVVARRKDAFPVELTAVNYEDRYTDVAQVELFRGHPIYCSNLETDGYDLIIANDNSFIPSSVTEFDRDVKYVGRLIRDIKGQVFRIVNNTESRITVENIATAEDQQAIPTPGSYVILADFPTEVSETRILDLIPDTYALRVDSNSFLAGDKITLTDIVDLTLGSEWNVGLTSDDTAEQLRLAIVASGVQYTVQRFNNILVIGKGTEDTLTVTTNTSSIQINQYSISGGVIFTSSALQKNELRDKVLQFGTQSYFVKWNEGNRIELYQSLAYDTLPDAQFAVLNSFNGTYPSPYKDNYRSSLEVKIKRGTGLESEKLYYYTAFTTKVRSQLVMNNETSGNETPLNFTVDKVGVYISRIFYESIVYGNSDLRSFTYDSGTGDVLYEGAPDLSGQGIQIGDTFSDEKGQRFTIVDNSQTASGIITLAAGLDVSTVVENPLHGAITKPNIPSDFSNIQVGDSFFDLDGRSFEVAGTSLQPTAGITAPPSNSIDVFQGLVDKVIFHNNMLVPFTYDPSSGTVQYGEQTVVLNRLLSSFSYNSISGIVQYSGGAIDLTQVTIGDTFVDGAENRFEVKEVNHQAQTITLDVGLVVDNTVDSNRDGAIIREVGFVDAEGNPLIDLTQVQAGDLFKTNSKPNITLLSANQELGRVILEAGLDDISTIVETPFDGSISRRGADVAWTGYKGELSETLQDIEQGAVRRYASTMDVQYALFSNPVSTQKFSISCQDRQFGLYMYKLFPSMFRMIDETGDLQDLMEVFGREVNELASIINTFELQNADLVYPAALERAASSKGVDLTSETLGIDTRRRVMRDIQTVYQSKGSREAIYEYIKILTTWDITNGTGDLREAIIDDTPETTGLRFYSPSLGDDNTKFIDTLNVQSPPAGRFYKGISGITLPGFFTFKEVIINLPNVAYELGFSTDMTLNMGNTIVSDDNTDFGQVNSLVGCFLIPNEGNPNDFYEIVSNTSTTITVRGSVPIDSLGAKYVVLSPLNLNRFVALSASIDEFMPHDTVPVFNFQLLTV